MQPVAVRPDTEPGRGAVDVRGEAERGTEVRQVHGEVGYRRRSHPRGSRAEWVLAAPQRVHDPASVEAQCAQQRLATTVREPVKMTVGPGVPRGGQRRVAPRLDGPGEVVSANGVLGDADQVSQEVAHGPRRAGRDDDLHGLLVETDDHARQLVDALLVGPRRAPSGSASGAEHLVGTVPPGEGVEQLRSGHGVGGEPCPDGGGVR